MKGLHCLLNYDGLDFQCFMFMMSHPFSQPQKKEVKKTLIQWKKGIKLLWTHCFLVWIRYFWCGSVIFGVDPFNARVAIYVILFVCMMSPDPVVKILKVSMNKSLGQDELVD